MPPGLESNIQFVAGVGAMLWAAYKLLRRQRVQSAFFVDQVGMALWTLSLVMFCSRIGSIAF
jgi:hypothetical protein